MEDMYLGRRQGEEAMLALQHMAYLAHNHGEGMQASGQDRSNNRFSSSAAAAGQSVDGSVTSEVHAGHICRGLLTYKLALSLASVLGYEARFIL